MSNEKKVNVGAVAAILVGCGVAIGAMAYKIYKEKNKEYNKEISRLKKETDFKFSKEFLNELKDELKEEMVQKDKHASEAPKVAVESEPEAVEVIIEEVPVETELSVEGTAEEDIQFTKTEENA